MCESTRDMMASFFHLVPGITSFADGQRSDLNTGAATPGAPTKHVSAQAAVSASKNPIVPAPIGQFAPPGSPVKMASVIIVPIIMKPPYPPAPVRLVKLRKFDLVTTGQRTRCIQWPGNRPINGKFTGGNRNASQHAETLQEISARERRRLGKTGKDVSDRFQE